MCDPITRIHNTTIIIIVHTELTVMKNIQVMSACLGCSDMCLWHYCELPKTVARSWAESCLFYGVSIHRKLPESTSEVRL